MAFNKSDNQPVIQSGFISSSRGTDTNRAFGELFEGVGRTLTNGLNAYDDATRTNIEMEANAGVNELAEADTPPAVTEGVNSIKAMADAKAQGAYSDSEYQTRILAKVKQLKAKLPAGYHSVVDAAYSSALGTSSANRLRSERIAAMKAAEGNVSDTEKARIGFFDKNNQVLVSQQGQKLYKDLTGKDFDFTTAGINEMRYVVARIEGEKYDREQELAQANVDQRRTKSAVTGWVIGEMGKGLSEANPLFKKFQDSMAASRAAGSPGGEALTDEERAELIPIWQNFQTQFRAGLKASMYSPEAADAIKNMKDEDRKDIFTMVDERFSAYDEILKSPTPQVLKLLEDDIAVKTKKSETELMEDPAVSMYMEMIKRGVPKEQIEDLLTKQVNPKTGKPFIDGLNERINRALILRLMTNKTTITKGLADAEKEGATPEQLKASIDNVMKTIVNDSVSPEVAAGLAKEVFAPDSKDIIEKYAKENPLKMFDTFVKPDVWDRVKGTDAEQRFVDFAEHQFVILGQKTGSALIDAKTTMEYGSIRFDGKRFLLDETGITKQLSDAAIPGVGTAYASYERAKLEAARKHVFTMNKYIGTMEPIWGELGIPQDQMAARILAAVGGDINSVESKGNIFTQTIKGLKDYISGPDGPLGEGTMDKAKKNLPPAMPEQKSEAPSMTGRSLVSYANQGSIRKLDITNELEGKISTAVETVLGDGYTAQVFSGGQPKKGSKGKRTGSIRHDEGKAADIYIFKDGKRVTDTKVLDKLKEYWLANDMGSIGTYMRGAGMHLDEWTKEELLAGMGQSWKY